MKNPHAYSKAEQAAIYKVIAERRDMRHFLPTPVATETLSHILKAAHDAPSVGLMQPWRFIRISNAGLRQAIYKLVDEERLYTAQAIGEHENATRMDEFLRLKVEGILECGELLVATLCNKREQHIFGRRTLPEMDIASAACAFQNLWLAARAVGLGMGWVSMFCPQQLAQLLHMPEGSQAIAILCLGPVQAFYDQPMLQTEKWAMRAELADMVFEDFWPAA